MRRKFDRPVLALAAAGLATLLVVGCGSTSRDGAEAGAGLAPEASPDTTVARAGATAIEGDESRPSGSDACAVMAAADVELLIGPAVPQSPATPYPDGRGCHYRTGTTRQLDFLYDSKPGRFDRFVKFEQTTPVTGVGEKAAEHLSPAAYTLGATNGRYFVEFGVFAATIKDVDQASVKTVMNRVLASLS
jgi:hypothetical protein